MQKELEISGKNIEDAIEKGLQDEYISKIRVIPFSSLGKFSYAYFS